MVHDAARFLYWSGIIAICKTVPEAPDIEKKCVALIDTITERYRTRDDKPRFDGSRMQTLEEKLDRLGKLLEAKLG